MSDEQGKDMTPMNQPHLASEQLPWWLRFIYQFGIPAAVSVFLIWWTVTNVDVKLDAAVDQMMALRADQQYSVKSNSDQVQRLDQIYRLMQRICVNSAKDGNERASCFSTDRPQP